MGIDVTDARVVTFNPDHERRVVTDIGREPPRQILGTLEVVSVFARKIVATDDLDGLGRSATARFFGIRSRVEAVAYLDYPVLGPRYVQSVEALQDLATSHPVAVFGNIDAMELRSSLTLFEAVRSSPLLVAALDRWFGGDQDSATLTLLGD